MRRMARDQEACDHTGEGIHQPESLNGIDRVKADTKNLKKLNLSEVLKNKNKK